jgi:hypothetical protein
MGRRNPERDLGGLNTIKRGIGSGALVKEEMGL